MAFEPEYGETLATHEERGALTSEVREILGEPVRKADLYDLEQLIQAEVANELVGEVLAGTLTVPELLTDHFVRGLHRGLYGPVWEWGGRHRTLETNIGVAPEHIAVDLRNALDDLRYRWEHQSGLTPRALGIATHAALVRIHPFVDGNGRVTRLLADLLFLAAQEDEPLFAYDWEIDRGDYIRLLRRYDETRDATALVEYVPVAEFGDER